MRVADQGEPGDQPSLLLDPEGAVLFWSVRKSNRGGVSMGIFKSRKRNEQVLQTYTTSERVQPARAASAGCDCGGGGPEAVKARQEGVQEGKREGVKSMFHALKKTVIVVERSHVESFESEWGDLLKEYQIEVVSPQGARDMNMGLHVKYGHQGPEKTEGGE